MFHLLTLFFLAAMNFDVFEANSKSKGVGSPLFSPFREPIFKFLLAFSLCAVCTTHRAYSFFFAAPLSKTAEEKRFAVYLNGRCIDCKTPFYLM